MDNWNDYAPPVGRHHTGVHVAGHALRLAHRHQHWLRIISDHFHLALGSLMHLLAAVRVAFSWDSMQRDHEVFLGVFRAMHYLWDQQ